MGDIIRKGLSISGIGARSVDGYLDAFGLLGIELQISGDESAMRAGSRALESVQKTTASGRSSSCQGVGAEAFPEPATAKSVRDVEMECGGIAVGGIVVRGNQRAGSSK